MRGAMPKRMKWITLIAFSLIAVPAVAARMTDAQVKQALIQESLASYPGNCPCPYNVDRRGHSCGRRSAYSRPGGYSPICYATDVTPTMITDFRRAHGQ
jgi:hypothetical protein